MMFKVKVMIVALLMFGLLAVANSLDVRQQVVSKLRNKVSEHQMRNMLLDLDMESVHADEDLSVVDAVSGKRRRRRGLGGISKGLKKAGKGISKTANTVAKGTTNAAKTVAKGTVDAANTVAKGTVTAATTVGQALENAAVTVGEGVVDAANAVAEVSETAFQAILDAVDCLRDGPQACIIDMMPRKFKDLQSEMQDAIVGIGQDFVDIMQAAGNIATTAYSSLGCKRNINFRYPDVSFNGAIPSISMKSKSVCAEPSFNAREFQGAVENLKSEVLDSTLISRLLSIGGGNSLIQTGEGSESRSRVATGHEVMGTPCRGFKGSFSLSAGGEYGGAAAAVGTSLGFAINVGCNNGVIDATFRFEFGVSLAVPGPNSAFWSLSWEKDYPGDIDDDSMWYGGLPNYPIQLGVITNGISDWVDAKGYQFNGVSVDYNIPVSLIEGKSLRSRSQEKSSSELFPGTGGFGFMVSTKFFDLS